MKLWNRDLERLKGMKNLEVIHPPEIRVEKQPSVFQTEKKKNTIIPEWSVRWNPEWNEQWQEQEKRRSVRNLDLE